MYNVFSINNRLMVAVWRSHRWLSENLQSIREGVKMYIQRSRLSAIESEMASLQRRLCGSIMSKKMAKICWRRRD